MSPDEVLAAIGRHKASAILRTDDANLAAPAMEAALRGGFAVIEFTLTIPGALELIREFSRREGICVGAGTVLTVEQARDAVRAGARYLVSPVTDEAVIAAARSFDVVAMPGAHTPTELLRAHRAGAALQKLFPAPAGGPAFVRSVRGPWPFLRIVPTNGVDAQTAREWLDAGAYALGFVNAVFDPADLRARAFERIEIRAKEIVASVAAAGGSGLE